MEDEPSYPTSRRATVVVDDDLSLAKEAIDISEQEKVWQARQDRRDQRHEDEKQQKEDGILMMQHMFDAEIDPDPKPDPKPDHKRGKKRSQASMDPHSNSKPKKHNSFKVSQFTRQVYGSTGTGTGSGSGSGSGAGSGSGSGSGTSLRPGHRTWDFH